MADAYDALTGRSSGRYISRKNPVRKEYKSGPYYISSGPRLKGKKKSPKQGGLEALLKIKKH